jgi:hypothetical protein
MNADAILMMVGAESIITVVTIYFFWRVLTMPKKKEPDSYSDN